MNPIVVSGDPMVKAWGSRSDDFIRSEFESHHGQLTTDSDSHIHTEDV